MSAQHRITASCLFVGLLSGCWQDDIYLRIENLPEDASELLVRVVLRDAAPYLEPQRASLRSLGLDGGKTSGTVHVSKSSLWSAAAFARPANLALEVAALSTSGCKLAGTSAPIVSMAESGAWPQEVSAPLVSFPQRCTVSLIPTEQSGLSLGESVRCPAACSGYRSPDFDITRYPHNCTEACQADPTVGEDLEIAPMAADLKIAPLAQMHGIRIIENGEEIDIPIKRISQPHVLTARFSPSWCTESNLCLQNPLLSQPVNAIWQRKSDNIWIVGNAGSILHYNGRYLVAYTAKENDRPVQDDLYSVSASVDGSVVWAVGAAGRILRFDGNNWKPVVSPTTRLLEGVWVSPDGTSVWLAGSGPTLLQYSPDGRGFTDHSDQLKASSPAEVSELRAISGDKTGVESLRLWLGANARWVLSYDPEQRKVVTYDRLNDTELFAIRSIFANAGEIYAVGGNNVLWRRSGTTWAASYPVSAGVKLRSVWGTVGRPSVFVAGEANSDSPDRRGTIRYSVNGKDWSGSTALDLPGDYGLVAGGGDLDTGFLVGGNGVLSLKRGGAPYQDLSPTADLNAVYTLPDGETWMGGDSGFFMRHKDSVYSHVRGAPGSASVNAIFGISANQPGSNANNTFWAVGSSGATWSNTGGGWNRTAAVVNVDLHDLSGTAEGEMWAVGNSGTVLHADPGGDFRKIDIGIQESLRGVSAVGRGQAWIVGRNGVIGRLTGSQFESFSSSAQVTGDLYSVAAVSSNEVYAVGSESAVLHYDGKEFQRLPVSLLPIETSLTRIRAVPSGLRAVSGSLPVLWAVGERGSLFSSSNGTIFQSVRNPVGPLRGISLINGRDAWFVGTRGAVLRYQASTR